MPAPESFKPFSELKDKVKQEVLDRATRFGVTGYESKNSQYKVYGPSDLTDNILVDSKRPTRKAIRAYNKWMRAIRNNEKFK